MSWIGSEAFGNNKTNILRFLAKMLDVDGLRSHPRKKLGNITTFTL